MDTAIRLCGFGAVLLSLLDPLGPRAAGQDPAAGNDPNSWVSYGSRESGGALVPRLVVERPDGTRESLLATADTVLIGYISRGSYGGFQWLAVSLCRSNCALIRFGPVPGPIRKAEIVLRSIPPGRASASPNPPAAPFDLGAYEVREPWDEHRASWDTRPTAVEEPAGTARARPDAAEVRIDVTARAGRLADPDAASRGWLIQVVRPLPWDGPEPGAGAAVERELLDLFTWADSIPAAVRKARAEGKLVLACVRSEFQPEKTSYLEQMLLAAVLADPDVRALIARRFVPVRVNVNPAEVPMDDGKPRAADPLTGLGLSLRDAKPTALVISDGERLLAALTNMGTFDRDLVLRLLLGTTAQGAAPAAAGAPARDAWAHLEAGRPDEARRLFAQIGGPEGEIGQARAASLLGDHEAALRHARPLARSDGPFRIQAAVVAGRALLRLGRPGEAVPLLREAARGGPGFGDGPAYDLGCALLRAGEPEAARAAWRDVAARFPGTPSAVRARARMTWPEAMAMYENLTAIGPEAGAVVRRGTTVVDRAGDEDRVVRTAVDYLFAAQDRDGTWSSASQAGTYRVAITSLVARSLHLWSAHLDGDRGARAARAAARATAWLNREIGRVDPAWMDSFGAAYLLDYFLDLEEMGAADRGDVAGAIRLLLAGQCPGGGWSYNLRFAARWAKERDPRTFPGRTHSMNTGLALLALARAKRLGHDVDAKAIDEGRKALMAMRVEPGVYTYIYPGPKNFHTPDSSAARGAICEHALALLGAVPDRDIDAAVDRFLKYRDDLRAPVKVWGPTWLPPHAYTSYFYFFAYDHAARAIAHRGERAAERLGRLRDDILRVVEADGTWLDFEPIGKPYGTAMALHVLYLARQARDRDRSAR
jgi:tetratricopeptide (TPR) repeat protein